VNRYGVIVHVPKTQESRSSCHAALKRRRDQRRLLLHVPVERRARHPKRVADLLHRVALVCVESLSQLHFLWDYPRPTTEAPTSPGRCQARLSPLSIKVPLKFRQSTEKVEHQLVAGG
jgi:hypothetical protein